MWTTKKLKKKQFKSKFLLIVFNEDSSYDEPKTYKETGMSIQYYDDEYRMDEHIGCLACGGLYHSLIVFKSFQHDDSECDFSCRNLDGTPKKVFFENYFEDDEKSRNLPNMKQFAFKI